MHKDNGGQPRSGADRSEVAQRAYQLWEAGGHPSGRDLEFWLQAEAELHSASQGSSPKAASSGAGPARESASASAPSPQATRAGKPGAPKNDSVPAVSFDGAQGSKQASSKSRPVAPTPTEVRRSASAR
jgi:hypothetical protein